MKANLIVSLRAFVNQRPGLEFGNYGDVTAYRSELRSITKTRSEALEMLNYIAWHDSITVDDIIDAAQHNFSGRLEITRVGDGFKVGYCTGQYWPTEYRKAVACVCAGVLWSYFRDNASIHEGKPTYQPGIVHMGDAVRKAARRELSRSITQKYFN